jgi:single-strand DNA-binding protein
MSSLNRATIIGNVGKDPEIRATQDGREIASLSVATSESWKDKNTGEKRDATEWHRVVVFNEGLVKVIKQYVTKGTKLMIEGQIKTRKWTDKDGQEKYSTEIVIQNFGGQMILLGGKPGGAASGGAAAALDDEIPFALILPALGISSFALNYIAEIANHAQGLIG